MEIDFNPYFKKYEQLVKQADAAFDRVRKDHGDCVTCREGCSDCCFALFDLSFVEAVYISDRFHRTFRGREKTRIEEVANTVDRRLTKIKRQALKDVQSGMSEADVLDSLSKTKVRCPMLDAENRCLIYAFRPITCRFYGIPTAIGGAGHTCGKSNFAKGRSYPTVNLDLVHAQLYQISEEMVRALNSRYTRMAELLVPVSMAVLTTYDATYLGITDASNSAPKESAEGK